MFSWNASIGRAQQLAESSTPAKELLTFYATVLTAQKQIYDSLCGRRDWLPSGSLEDDLSILHEHARFFLKSVSSVAPRALAEQADASDELLLEYWHNRSDKLFFPKAFLQPYAHWSVQSGALSRQSSTPENRCPYCFGKPQLSFLRVTESGSESGNRHLFCATCLSSWEFRRVVCASCSEERPFKLEYFKSDEFDHVRIEACESCKQYIKGIDLTRLGLAVPLVDDVASAALDLWATEKGYAKIELNLVGL
ncbi:MAG TPA: formate dehydrogenase accessory protein FdhE [Pyrinomonadaceae bacterium]|nr:formate dehydrogenase accessory protein FdhE [Pyrinomonadaceae bacterium]